MKIRSKKVNLMNSKKHKDVEDSCFYDVYVMNFFCEVTLMRLKKMSSIFPLAVIWRGCVKRQISLYLLKFVRETPFRAHPSPYFCYCLVQAMRTKFQSI